MKKNILVLGGYGLIGREVIKGLINKTEYNVLASGRNEKKLNEIVSNTKSSRLKTLIFDANDSDELRSACNKSDIVINCIGPYSLNGYEIAESVIKSRSHYIDCANEQIQYQRLKSLHTFAKEKGLIILTAAGQIPGISTLIANYGYNKIKDASSIEMYHIQDRLPDPEVGINGVVGAILEPLFNSVQFRDGKFEKARIGSEYKKINFSPNYNVNVKEAMSIPTIDDLILPQYMPIKSTRVYFGIDMKPPPGIFSIVKLLKPHKRKWAYKMLYGIVKSTVHKSYCKALKKGYGSNGFLRLTIKNYSECWEGIVPFDSGEEMISYLPILLTKQIFEGKIQKRGLLTVLDIYDYHQFLKDLNGIGCDIRLQEAIHRI